MESINSRPGEGARENFVNLVLPGRSPMNGVPGAELGKTAALGGEALHLQADAAIETELPHAVRETKARFGAWHGVIHSALVP